MIKLDIQRFGGRGASSSSKKLGYLVINEMIKKDIEEAKDILHKAIEEKRNVKEKLEKEGKKLTERKVAYDGTTYTAINPEYQKVLEKYKYYLTLNYNYGTKGAETRIEKDINAHYKSLQAKVESKIGTIKYITKTGNNGYDYRMENAKGNSVAVEVIGAGGYNVQRYHTRWIIKKQEINL